jgi:Flp pilus assembly protein TadG
LTVSSNKAGDLGGARETLGQLGISIKMWADRLRGITAAEGGAELFEFAIVVPLLLMLLLGIVWMGRAYNVYETITRAAREGARYAVLRSSVAAGNAYADTLSSSCSSGTNAYNNYVAPALRADSLDPAKVQNYCQKTAWLENTYPQQCGVVISFSYPLELAIPFTSLNASTIDIKASAQMRLEDQSAGGTCP